MSSATSDVRERIARLLADMIRPALQSAGADIELVDLGAGTVKVRLRGGPDGCPSTALVLVMGVEEQLRTCVPGVEHLEVVP